MPVTSAAMAAQVEFMTAYALTRGCTGPRILFRTTSTWTGASIGGITGADAKCNADAAKPAGTGNYKALLADSSGLRSACTTANCSTGVEGIDWALQASCSYIRPDGTAVFTTNSSGIFVFGNFTNTIDASAGGFWTGLLSNWMVDAGNRCNNWNTGGGSGAYGFSNQTGTAAIATGLNSCNAPTLSLVCAQQ